MRRAASVAGLFRLLGWLAVVGVFVIAFTPLANVVGGRLYIPPRLGPAGAIVVLGGTGSEHRAIVGIRLYRKGLAPLMVLSGVPLEIEQRETLARDLGVPQEALATEGRARTSREEALKVGALLRARGVRRILLVTDSLSMRRARGVFERAGFEVLPAPSTGPGDRIGRPEDQLGFALTIAEETVAYLYYRLIGYL